MYTKPYIFDSEYDISLNSYNETIPLCYGIIYYVESKENDPMNNLVRQYFQQDPNRLLPRDLRQMPYCFRYLTQEEIQSDRLCGLLTEAGVDTDSRAANETLDLLHECLHSNTGGFLVARLLPEPPKKDKDDELIAPKDRLLSCSLPDTADLDTCIGNFIITLAKTDFESLAGVSYGHYYSDKYEWRGSGSSSGTMGFLIPRLDINKVDRTLQQTLTTLLENGQIKLSDSESIDDTPELLKKIAAAIEDNKKIDKFCTLSVDKRGRFTIDTPQGNTKKCDISRGPLARSLYVLFLRQIQRAADDPTGKTPKYLCPALMEAYEDELLAIYKEMKPTASPRELRNTINNYGKQEALNDISSINTDFKGIFYLDVIEKNYKKNYTIIKLDDHDPKTGQNLYAVGLDVDDFKLGYFSINSLKV